MKCSAGCFKYCRGHTTGSPKIEFERNRFPVFNHKVNPFHSADIRNFMRIADGSNSAMHNGKFCKFGRNKHRTFNMKMAVYKAGENVVRSLEPGVRSLESGVRN